VVKREQSTGAALTPELIVTTALRLADAEGDPNKITIRRIAAELGVGPMSLYTYFRNKDMILDGMADHALGRMKFEESPDAGPAAAIRSLASALLSTMQEHPSIARLFAARQTDSQGALHGSMEIPLRRLVDAGIPGPLAVKCYGFLITFAIGFSSYQAPRPWGLSEAGAEAQEMRRQRQHLYAGLPKTEFPLVVELAEEIVDIPSARLFNYGVEALIATVLQELQHAESRN
jgi:AcrR family transcriptional regulator